MELNFLNHFNEFRKHGVNAFDPYQGGTAFFRTGGLGKKVSERMEDMAGQSELPRREFFKSALGFTGAMLAVNAATGMRFFEVSDAEAQELAALEEVQGSLRGKAGFVVDMHTHVCTRPQGYVEGVNTTEQGMWFVNLLDGLGKAFGMENGTADMNIENFGKMLLEGSDTDVAVFNPFGFREDYGGQDMVPMEYQAQVKEAYPSQTIMMAGGLTPNQGVTETLERMQMFVEDYKASGLKLYTFDSTPQKGWWFDDEKRAYPMWEKARELGIKNIGCHKGIPFGQFMARYAHAEDFDKACDDFLDLNFIAFHSAWPYHGELAAMKGFKPQRNNMYCEIGSTFAATVTSRPMECAHVLGTLVRDLGADYVMWGTDSLLWGNPQWQIDAFRRFRIPDELIDGYGYPQLTDEVKAKILGGNAARLWGLETAMNDQGREVPVVDFG
jgi:predicted TIM-barrel fold metal-dependent hydrolase